MTQTDGPHPPISAADIEAAATAPPPSPASGFHGPGANGADGGAGRRGHFGAGPVAPGAHLRRRPGRGLYRGTQ